MQNDVGDLPHVTTQGAAGKQREVSVVIPTITVFLPRSLRQGMRKGYKASNLVGWCFAGAPTDDKLFIVVAGLITSEQTATNKITTTNEVMKADSPACVVGECSFTPRSSTQEKKAAGRRESDKIWLEVGCANSSNRVWLPEIYSIQAPLVCGFTAQCAINVVLYTIPQSNRMMYLSLEPMLLPAASSAGILDRSSRAIESHEEGRLRRRMEELIRLDPIRHQDIATEYLPGRAPGEGFRKAIALLNQCSYLNESISSASSQKLNGIHSNKTLYSFNSLYPALRLIRSICRSARSMLNAKIKSIVLLEVSATARQLELRLGQSIIWPSLAILLRRQRRKEHEPVSNLSPRYVALYNGVWLVLNDLILGQTVGIWLCDNHEVIARFISKWMRPILIEGLVDTLTWLDNWPAGLKLNTQLSHFFRDMFVGLTTVWNEVVIARAIANDDQVLSSLVYLVGWSSRFMGLTMLLSLIVDILQLFTFHWTVYYWIQRAIFGFFASSIVSLFHLFRGKKRNPLRKNRTDDATYDLDQLLLGTIFFTLFLFLFLTVAVYYLHFSLLRLSIVGIITILQTFLALLNHLPLFALMLRVKEPGRLPGGVELRLQEVQHKSKANCIQCSYFELYNIPLGLQDIFRGYNDHLQALRNLPRLLWRLILGQKF